MYPDLVRLYEVSTFEPSESDLDFVISVVAPDFKDKRKLKQLIREDRSFRRGLFSNEKLFRKVMDEEETVARISPALLFEILLRRTTTELERRDYILESAGRQNIPVFHSKKAASFLAAESNLDYLVSMLSSFTRSESFVLSIRIGRGIWRKLRFNDMDIDNLIRLCSLLDEEERFPLYKRIADLCLFILGIFPEYALPDSPSRSDTGLQMGITKRLQRTAADYEREGIMFYNLAKEHRRAEPLGLKELLHEMEVNFNLARGCLNFVSEHYLRFRKNTLFGMGNI